MIFSVSISLNDASGKVSSFMPSHPPLIYVGRSRLHRNRANLIQALHVAKGFKHIGLPMRMYLPPAEGVNLRDRLSDFGVDPDLDIRPTQWLHTRYGLWPFFLRRRRELKAALGVFTPLPKISYMLSAVRISHVLEIHDAERDLIKKGFMDYVAKAHREGLIAHLVPVSRAARELLIKGGADPARVTVAPNAVDVHAYTDVPTFDAKNLAHPRFVYLGAIEAGRGLEVFDAIAATGIGTVNLIGTVSAGFRPHENANVRPFVPHHEVPSWYGQSDITLLPYSKSLATADSMSPMKLFEALAAGRPIIASDLPVLREILEHEKTALFVSPDDIGAWLKAILRLQAEPELALRLAEGARALSTKFSWEQRARNIAAACGWQPPSPGPQ